MHLRKLKTQDAQFMLEWMHDDSVIHYMRANFAAMQIDDCMNFIEESMYEKQNVHLAITDDNDEYILVSAMILLLFLQIDFKNKIINELAKGCFTCFLFHTPFVYHLNTEKAATSTIFYLIVHQFSVAIVLFMVSYIIYKIYAFCTKRGKSDAIL